MENDSDGEQQIVRRLQAFGRVPMDDGMADRVLARATHPRRSWWRSTKTKVAAGIVGGFAVGSVGLASAGALPAPVQHAAHNALGAVAISVPSGHARYNGPECGGTYANHGAYVRAHHGDPGAAQSRCGKPTNDGPSSVTPSTPGSATTTEDGNSAHHGPPPWAHGHGHGRGNDDTAEPPDDEAAGGAAQPGHAATAPPTTAPAPTTVALAPTTAAPTTTAAAPTTTTTTTTLAPSTTAP